MTTANDDAAFPREEFGGARLGNALRTGRAVAMTERMVARPGGTITRVFDKSADREAAFRFVENDNIDWRALAASAHEACARRCVDAVTPVPIDATSLLITDLGDDKGLGAVGSSHKQGKGLQVLTAIAVGADGTPLGILAQDYWSRPRGQKRSAEARRALRPEEKETGRVLELLASAQATLTAEMPSTKPWYQLDRGYDAWPVLRWVVEHDVLATVRASWDRRLWDGERRSDEQLWERLASQEALGDYVVEVPARPGQPARRARIELRACKVTLALRDHLERGNMPTTVGVVLAREANAPTRGERIEWMLLTTHPVDTIEDAYAVVDGYVLRWRIEDFHRVWKSGACNVEDTQLREADHIIRWAVLQASVAMRLLRLTHLARQRPEAPATDELTRSEIDAAILATEQRKWKPGDTPPIALVVDWIARLGGYTGKSSGGPPGAIVIRRGLDSIALLARVLANQRRGGET